MKRELYTEGDTIYLYEKIGKNGKDDKDGITAKDFTKMLNVVKQRGDILRLRINCGGGSVYDGFTILSAIKDSGLTVIVHIDGLAASMASVIALSGHKVYMSNNAMLMIHNPKGGMVGEAKDFDREAKVLRKIKKLALRLYKERTGLDENILSSMMDKETWLDAKEAFDFGFIDEISDATFEMEKVPAVMTVDNIYNSYKFKKGKKMNINTLTLMGLPPTATVEELNSAIKLMVAENGKLSDEVGKIEDSRIDTFLEQAVQSGKLETSLKDGYRTLLKKDFATTSNLINNLPSADSTPITVTSLLAEARRMNSNQAGGELPVDKSKWTLDDYRKNASHELEANPQLLNQLIEKYGN